MRQLTDQEVQLAQLLKAARSAIRLKHALAADRECYALLPEIEKEAKKALAAGQTYVLDTEALLSRGRGRDEV